MNTTIHRIRAVVPAWLAIGVLIASFGVSPALGQCQVVKVFAADGAAEDWFGQCVALDGSTFVVSAVGDDDIGTDSGSAYVFHYDGTNWVQRAKLLASDGAAGDTFGFAPSIDGDTIVCSAPRHDYAAPDTGAAYVFRYDGTAWVQEAKLLADDAEEGDVFGGSNAMHGGLIVVGAERNDDNGTDSGSAYVFRYNGSDWLQEAKLLPDDGAAGDHFGSQHIALYGNVALIAAPDNDNENGIDAGAVYVFRYDGSSWNQEAKLLPADGEPGDRFGCGPALNGDIAVVGSYLDDDNGTDSGSAYVFHYDGTNWVQRAKLLTSDGSPLDWFGFPASIDGGTIMIGALGAYGNGKIGSAYVFRRHGSTWVEGNKIQPADSAPNDAFGVAVAVHGEIGVIGAPLHDELAPDAGAVYIYDLSMSHCAGDLNCDGIMNAFDIDPFVLALTDPDGYAAAWPDCDRLLADIDGNGVVNAFDIDPFVELLTGG